jgi:hypothetical protein
MPEESRAEEPRISAEIPWVAVEIFVQASPVQIHHDSRRTYEPNHPTFVIRLIWVASVHVCGANHRNQQPLLPPTLAVSVKDGGKQPDQWSC